MRFRQIFVRSFLLKWIFFDDFGCCYSWTYLSQFYSQINLKKHNNCQNALYSKLFHDFVTWLIFFLIIFHSRIYLIYNFWKSTHVPHPHVTIPPKKKWTQHNTNLPVISFHFSLPLHSSLSYIPIKIPHRDM